MIAKVPIFGISLEHNFRYIKIIIYVFLVKVTWRGYTLVLVASARTGFGLSMVANTFGFIVTLLVASQVL